MVLNPGRYSYKALYFDLQIHNLKQYYSANNPNGAYNKIQQFMFSHNFMHEQYSGYHSNFKTTDLKIFKLIKTMKAEFPWLSKCAAKFEVTDIGENYNLISLLTESPTILS